MISPSNIRVNEYRRQDLIAAVARDRLIDEARKAAPAAPKTKSVGRVRALTLRVIAALVVLRHPGVGQAAEA